MSSVINKKLSNNPAASFEKLLSLSQQPGLLSPPAASHYLNCGAHFLTRTKCNRPENSSHLFLKEIQGDEHHTHTWRLLSNELTLRKIL